MSILGLFIDFDRSTRKNEYAGMVITCALNKTPQDLAMHTISTLHRYLYITFHVIKPVSTNVAQMRKGYI